MKTLLFLVLLLGATAGTSAQTNFTPMQIDTVFIHRQTTHPGVGQVVRQSEFHLSFVFPSLTDSSAAAATIRTELTQHLAIGSDDTVTHPWRGALALEHDFVEQMIAEFDITEWGSEYLFYLTSSITQTPHLFTAQIEREGYAGGAHGYYSILWINANRQTGKTLTVDKLFTTKGLPKLLELLAHHAPQDRLYSSDYAGPIQPSKSFSIKPGGITFIYNPYDIGPWSSGVIEIKIPLTELKKILHPEAMVYFQ